MITNTRIGVLGGGQLGKMLLQAASKWDLNIWAVDKEFDYPAAKVTNQFIQGDFKNYQLVSQLGQHVDIVTIEIENVNTTALKKLEAEGKEIYPQPGAVEIIKDKGTQKQFFAEQGIPTSKFSLHRNKKAILTAVRSGEIQVPFVQKARTEGYDGRGVHIVRSKEDLKKLLNVESVVEELVEIDKELAVLVARNPSGDIAVYPPVEMEFHPTANLVERLISPARVSDQVGQSAQALGKSVIEAFELVGLLAIEMFLTKSGDILVNEVAPRPHNSGHHTIEGNVTSQYEQHLRAILDLPLGGTDVKSPAVMINLLGEPEHKGEAYYEGLEQCLAMENVHVHIYGKRETRPFRKMGHVTILHQDIDQAIAVAKKVRDRLKVIS